MKPYYPFLTPSPINEKEAPNNEVSQLLRNDPKNCDLYYSTVNLDFWDKPPVVASIFGTWSQ